MGLSGRIVAIGKHTTDSELAVGDDVAVNPFLASPGQPPSYEPKIDVLGVTVDGGMQAHIVLPVAQLHHARGVPLDSLVGAAPLAMGMHALQPSRYSFAAEITYFWTVPLSFLTIWLG